MPNHPRGALIVSSPLLRARRIISAVLAFVGLIGAGISYQAAIIRSFVLDPDVVVDASANIAGESRLQSELADEIAAAVTKQVLPPSLAGDLLARDVHLSADLRNASLAAVADERFQRILSEHVRNLHRYVFTDHSTLAPLRLDELMPLIHKQLVDANPIYAKLVPKEAPLTVEIDASKVPDLTKVRERFEHDLSRLALVSVGLVALSIAVSPRRPTALKRIATWCLAVALLQLAIAFALPVASSAVLPEGASVIGEYMARSLIPRLLVPAGALLFFGIGGVVCGRRWQRQQDQRHERIGADAFLTAEPLLAMPAFNSSAAAPAEAPKPKRRRARSADVPDTPAPLFDLPEDIRSGAR